MYLTYLAQVVLSFPEVEIAIQRYSTQFLKKDRQYGKTRNVSFSNDLKRINETLPLFPVCFKSPLKNWLFLG